MNANQATNKRPRDWCPLHDYLIALVEAWRTKRGLTVNGAAVELDISQPILQRYIRRQRGISLKSAAILAERIGYSLQFVAESGKNPEPQPSSK